MNATISRSLALAALAAAIAGFAPRAIAAETGIGRGYLAGAGCTEIASARV